MKSTTKRRWIYMISALLVVCCILLLVSPNAAIARMAIVVAPADKNGSVSELVMKIPTDCLLNKIYLRGNGKVPREGRLFTLVINNTKYPINDFGLLPAAEGESVAGYENKAVALPMEALSKASELVVTYEELDERVKREDLFLIIEIAGEEETVKKWNEVIKLRSRKINTIAVEKTAVSVEKTADK